MSLNKIDKCSDNIFQVGEKGVIEISQTLDKKVEFIKFSDKTIAFVKSEMGYPAYYPIHPVKLKKPVKAVLMDLDGTSVKSENFWISIIEMTTQSLLDDSGFQLHDHDLPFVSGHSVSEHLKYCVDKYCSHKSVEEARAHYFSHTKIELEKIMRGESETNAFEPTPELKKFLLKLKENNIKIGLVTSGLYEKAWPEIVSAFDQLDLGDPKDFYDSIITAGFPLRPGEPGTLGELSPKPHPWLYAEVARVGLGMPFEDRNSVVGIEDSGAGVCSLRLAGFPTIGISGGNIIESGTKELCDLYCDSFDEIIDYIL